MQNASSDAETIGISYNKMGWNVGFFSKRVAGIFQDNASLHQAVAIDPFDITNLFVNYTLRGAGRFSQSRIRFAINNLTTTTRSPPSHRRRRARPCQPRETC